MNGFSSGFGFRARASLGLSCAFALGASLAACSGGLDAIVAPPVTSTSDDAGDARAPVDAADAADTGPVVAPVTSGDAGDAGDAADSTPPAQPEGTRYVAGDAMRVEGVTSDGYFVYSDAANTTYTTLTRNPPTSWHWSRATLLKMAFVDPIFFEWSTYGGGDRTAHELLGMKAGQEYVKDDDLGDVSLDVPAVSPDGKTIAWVESNTQASKGPAVYAARPGAAGGGALITNAGCISGLVVGNANVLVGHCTAADTGPNTVTLTAFSSTWVKSDLAHSVVEWDSDRNATLSRALIFNSPANANIQISRSADAANALRGYVNGGSFTYSADGEWLYVADRTPQNANAGLARISRTTLAKTTIAPTACGWAPVKLSPDERQATCDSEGPGTDLVTIATGDVKHLGCMDYHATFSTDGTQFRCAATDASMSTAHDLDVYSTAIGALALHVNGFSNGYTADDKYFLFHSSDTLYFAQPMAGGAPVPIASVVDTAHFSIAPLAGSLVLVREGSRVTVVDASGKTAPRVLTTQLALTDASFAVTPDHTKLVYVTSTAPAGIYVVPTGL